MNLYFVVEGDTEYKVYPDWLNYLLPQLQRVKKYSQVQTNNYFLINGGGYPSLYDLAEAAVEEINIIQKYNYLIICLDAEENDVAYIKQEVEEFFPAKKLDLGNTQLKVIVQNRCIETWFLGNNKIYSRQPQSQPLLDYTRYYNISTECPELMGKYDYAVHAAFHEAYLKELFFAKNMQYSKTKPRDVQKEYYLKELRNRVDRQINHLPTLREFFDFCDLVRSQLR